MYGKLFSQMYDGTLATKGPWQALVTFQQLIILADRHGTVDMTTEAIARRTTIPHDVIELGITELEKPDPDSRTPDEQGRRIVRLSDTRPWGWIIVNYAHYRVLRSDDERREYHRKYWREKRSPKITTQQNSTNSTKAVSSKQDAVGRKQKTPTTRARGNDSERTEGQNLKGAAFAILADIRATRITTQTPQGPRHRIPQDVIEALPPRAKRALEVIGGAALIANADDDRMPVHRSQFAEAYLAGRA